MNALSHSIPSYQEISGVIVSDDLADLSHIYDPDINLCLIRRKPCAQLKGFVDELLLRPVEIDLAATIDFERFNFSSLLPDCSTISGHNFWWRDVAQLTCIFCDLLGNERVGLRLRTLDHPMCPRFHTDHVPCRLVCTYGGVGTEWLPDESVDRTKLGLGAKGLSDRESGLILDDSAVHFMPSYAVGLMKGNKWEGNEGRGLVHRSPSPTLDCPRRLLLTLDMAN